MRGRIFISYRRDDAPGDARSIRERLAMKFGESAIFMDIDNLMAGQRFDQELEKALAECQVLIAIIGGRWMDLLSQHRRAGGRDYVREEITAALKREIPVIPVLVGREGRLPAMPRGDELPKELSNLVFYQKHAVVHESFARDTSDLTFAVGKILRQTRPSIAPWQGLAMGGATGLAAAAAVAAVLVGAIFWLQSRPSGETVLASAKSTPAVVRETRTNIQDVSFPRSAGESTQSVLDEGARRTFQFYKDSAASGNIGAMVKLATSYEDGVGVAKNSQQALVWYQKAADAGNVEAKAGLQRLKGKAAN